MLRDGYWPGCDSLEGRASVVDQCASRERLVDEVPAVVLVLHSSRLPVPVHCSRAEPLLGSLLLDNRETE